MKRQTREGETEIETETDRETYAYRPGQEGSHVHQGLEAQPRRGLGQCQQHRQNHCLGEGLAVSEGRLVVDQRRTQHIDGVLGEQARRH